MRYTGFALSQTLSGALFGGAAPLVATWLIAATGSELAPAFWQLATAAVTLAAVAALRQTARLPLQGT